MSMSGKEQVNSSTQSSNKPILVTQPYIPELSKYVSYVEQAFNNKWLTNGGPLLQELEQRLKAYLQVEHLLIVNNGTSALQLAYQIKGLNNKVAVTTPFTFPATSTALMWQNAKVALADIDRASWNLCPSSVRAVANTQEIGAIVPVNIFGAPCDMEKFDQLGKEFDVPIIYDSAQSLLSRYKGNSIFQYGDIHCISFHATKLFHAIEGGALIFNNEQDLERGKRLINFGIAADGSVYEAGINAKMSELHAAMGLCILDDLEKIVADREATMECYKEHLDGQIEFQAPDYDSYTPPMYMAVKFKTESELLKANEALNLSGYQARRYFYPNNHKFISNAASCHLPNSDEISNKILCLPLMYGLEQAQVKNIANIVNHCVS